MTFSINTPFCMQAFLNLSLLVTEANLTLCSLTPYDRSIQNNYWCKMSTLSLCSAFGTMYMDVRTKFKWVLLLGVQNKQLTISILDNIEM